MGFWENCRRFSESGERQAKRMCRYKYLILGLKLGLLMALFSVQNVNAQSASFRSVDTNRDGVLSFDELAAQFGVEGARRLIQHSDSNNDNILTIPELRQERETNSDCDDNQTHLGNGDQEVESSENNDPGDEDDD